MTVEKQYVTNTEWIAEWNLKPPMELTSPDWL
jgi:hypothetical protein